jgi:hypothetical protein
MLNANSCGDCAQAEPPHDGVIWCAYWQAFFPQDHPACKPPAFVPLVLEEPNLIEITEQSGDVDS